MLEQFRVIHSGRARGHAGKAAETKVHLIGKQSAGLEPFIGDGSHERNPAPRAVALQLCRVVSRAGWQTKAAMHALLDHAVVEILEMPAAQNIFPGFNIDAGSSTRRKSRITRI